MPRPRSRKGKRRAARRAQERRLQREQQVPLLALAIGLLLTGWGIVLVPWAAQTLAYHPEQPVAYLVRNDLQARFDPQTLTLTSLVIGALALVGGLLLLDRQRVGWLLCQMALLSNLVFIVRLMVLSFDLVQFGGALLMLCGSAYLWHPSVREQFDTQPLGERWLLQRKRADDP